MRQKLVVVCLVGGLAGGVTALAQMKVPENPPAQAPASSAVAPAASQTAAQAATPAAAPAEKKYVVPAGTRMLLSLKSAVNTRTARPGDGVYLVSSFPVVVDGHVLIPDGVFVQGVIDRVKRPGRIKGRAEVGMHFTSIIFPNGSVVEIPGSVNSLPGSAGPKVKGSEGTVEQAGNKGRDAGTVVKGAGIGAEGGTIAGAATGNFGAGLGYGSLAGAAAGGLYTLFSRGDDINIPAGSNIEMVLQRPLTLAAQQYAVVNDQPPPQQQQFVPSGQQQPMQKPERQGHE